MIYGTEDNNGGDLPLEDEHEGCRLCQHNAPVTRTRHGAVIGIEPAKVSQR